MSKFFVGQRVRLVRGIDLVSPAIHYGWTGVIVGLGFWPKGTLSLAGPTAIDTDCQVDWDQCNQYNNRVQNTKQLEPILDPGASPSAYSYSELLEGLRSGELVEP